MQEIYWLFVVVADTNYLTECVLIKSQIATFYGSSTAVSYLFNKFEKLKCLPIG